jgi:hypothetical protein
MFKHYFAGHPTCYVKNPALFKYPDFIIYNLLNVYM